MRAIGWLRRVPLGTVAALLLGGAGGFLAWSLPAQFVGKVARHLHVVALLPQAAPPYSDLTRLLLAFGAGLVLALAVLLGFRRLEHGAWLRAPAAAATPDEPAPAALRRFGRPAKPPARPPLFASELMLDEPFPEEVDAPPVPVRSAAVDGPRVGPVAPDPVPLELTPPIETSAEAVPVERVPADGQVEHSPAPRPVRGGSVAELMARLESGLARRAHPPAAPEPAEPPLGDALRDALADLQRIARR